MAAGAGAPSVIARRLPFPPHAPLLPLTPLRQDYGVPQVQCALNLGPVTLALTPQTLQLLATALEPPPGSAQQRAAKQMSRSLRRSQRKRRKAPV